MSSVLLIQEERKEDEQILRLITNFLVKHIHRICAYFQHILHHNTGYFTQVYFNSFMWQNILILSDVLMSVILQTDSPLIYQTAPLRRSIKLSYA